MAKQADGLRRVGTLQDITFYKSNGGYYIRSKSSLDKKRVMHDKAFARSRERMFSFGAASRFCAEVYSKLPAACRGRGVQQKMTGMANRLLLLGMEEPIVQDHLLAAFGREPLPATAIDSQD